MSVSHTSVERVVDVRFTHHVLPTAQLHSKPHVTRLVSSSETHGIVHVHANVRTDLPVLQQAPSNTKLVKPEYENNKHTHTDRICLLLHHEILAAKRNKHTGCLLESKRQ